MQGALQCIHCWLEKLVVAGAKDVLLQSRFASRVVIRKFFVPWPSSCLDMSSNCAQVQRHGILMMLLPASALPEHVSNDTNNHCPAPCCTHFTMLTSCITPCPCSRDVSMRRYVELNAQPTLHEPEALDAQLAFDRLVHICKYFKGKLDPREYLCIWLQVRHESCQLCLTSQYGPGC